jgi:protein-S-isoprenylcysteine O-methyltransferase Ste14
LPIVAGIAVVLWCAHLFRKAATPIRPGEKPSSLVKHGPFAHSRNPIYVSMFAVLLGVALLLGSLSPFAGLPIFIAIIAHGFVPMEEAALEQAFGDDYRAYRERVHRWL